jgi:hypothetical protein
VAASSRKFQSLWLVLVLVAAACDPNVVIGVKRRLGGGGTGESGGSAETGGAGAVSGSAATVSGSGGVAGDMAGGGSVSDAGMPSVGTAGEAGAGGQTDDGLIFFADQDDGTKSLKQWDAGADDDSGGYYADATQPNPSYSVEQHHSGEGSAKIVIDTSTTKDQISRLYRRIETPSAYYMAWFYLAEDHTPDSWWSIFLFRAVKDRNFSIDLWSVDLVKTAQDTLSVVVFDHANSKTIDVPSHPKVPVKQWFQIQALLEQKAGQPSQLTLWLDGVQFLSLQNTTAAPVNQPLYWVIGNGAEKLTPGRSTIFIDDAQISTSFVRP